MPAQKPSAPVVTKPVAAPETPAPAAPEVPVAAETLAPATPNATVVAEAPIEAKEELVKANYGDMHDPYTHIIYTKAAQPVTITSWVQCQIDAGKLSKVG